MAKSLITKLVIAMSVLTLSALALLAFGWFIYAYYVYDWLFPEATYTELWSASDAVALGLILALGLMGAIIVGWRLAQNVVRPLKSIAKAVRAIAGGDFSARAETI
ncbi:HAMP domain-containing protein, partial [Phyllobacterium sp. 22229]|uniref:HAMP domain-containing protein n=1 Tax=Phyllobacterium sp. 22229 TaxID=3453895 RepID=UPI003F87EAD7